MHRSLLEGYFESFGGHFWYFFAFLEYGLISYLENFVYIFLLLFSRLHPKIRNVAFTLQIHFMVFLGAFCVVFALQGHHHFHLSFLLENNL